MLTVKQPIHSYGITLDLKVCVSTPRADALRAAGRQIPVPIDVAALLDTGADCSLLDASVIRQLKITPTDIVRIRCLDTAVGDEKRFAYDVDLVLVAGTESSYRFTIKIAEHRFGPLPYQALIGRDLLRFCTFFYDGPAEEVTLNV